MRVLEIQGQQAPRGVRKSISDTKNSAQFKKAMEEAVQKSSPKDPVATSRRINPPLPPGGVQMAPEVSSLSTTGKEPIADRIIGELEKTLDLVDFYARRLADPSIPTEDMGSLIQHLEERLETIESMEKDKAAPEGLKSIISDLLVTIGAETAKFRRGDYA